MNYSNLQFIFKEKLYLKKKNVFKVCDNPLFVNFSFFLREVVFIKGFVIVVVFVHKQGNYLELI